MSIIQSDLLLGQEGSSKYQVSRSLRFNRADGAYLTRTPSSAGNRKTWTFSFWYKKTKNSQTGLESIFGVSTSGSAYNVIRFGDSPDDCFRFDGDVFDIRTNAVFRDPSAWYHCVVSVDTTQATAANRIKLYVNGAQQTSLQSALYPSQNTDLLINSATRHDIGNLGATYNTYYLNGYLAECHFCDGAAYDASYFGETDLTTGQWIPKQFSGSYGSQGWKLDFSDNSNNTATTLGKDTANSNNWTPNNFSVTAGAGNDSLVDTPSSYGTGNSGGDVRGNFATLNPLINPSGDTFSDGNLQVTTSSSNYGTSVSTIATPTSGKWYAEVTITATATYPAVGICSTSSTFTATSWIGSLTGITYYGKTGNKYINGTSSSYGATYGLNDVIGIAYDADNLQITFYKNGASQGTITGVTAGTYYFGGTEWDPASGTQVWNFGQRAFAYTAPSGFKALCDTNLPAPVVAKPNTVFDIALYTGNGTTQTISGLNFSPDAVWCKERSSTSNHHIIDSVRGVNLGILPNDTRAEATLSPPALTAFTSSGFTVENNGAWNESSQTYAAWCWDAGTSTVTNTQGSITSQVRANASAGFSIVTYTGNGTSGATVGHGLGVTPEFIVVKRRDTAGTGWISYHKSLTSNQYYMYLNTTAAQASGGVTTWNLSSTTVGLHSYTDYNANGSTYVMYAWAPVTGYSSMGSYVGNGSSDGVFVYTGFRPKYLLVKSSSNAVGWYVLDSVRNDYNTVSRFLIPNASDAEVDGGAGSYVDFLSNGFKWRASNSAFNASSYTYIYFAVAENPFQYARAR